MHILSWELMSLLVLIVVVLGHTVCCCFRLLFMARLQALLSTYWQKNPLWVCCCWAWTNGVVAVVPEVGFRVLILFVCWDCFAAVMWSNMWLWRSWRKVSGRKKRLSFLTWSGVFSITLIPFSPFLLASFRFPFTPPQSIPSPCIFNLSGLEMVAYRHCNTWQANNKHCQEELMKSVGSHGSSLSLPIYDEGDEALTLCELLSHKVLWPHSTFSYCLQRIDWYGNFVCNLIYMQPLCTCLFVCRKVDWGERRLYSCIPCPILNKRSFGCFWKPPCHSSSWSIL